MKQFLCAAKRGFYRILLSAIFLQLGVAGSAYAGEQSQYLAPHAKRAPVIDGQSDEPLWQQAEWRAIDQTILGEKTSAADFSGRFKVVWTAKALYLLAEITDDVMSDSHADPLVHYWDDEALEIFVDEDASGGDHQYTHNAFAYHIALDNQVVDSGPDKKAHLYNDHVTSIWKRSGTTTTWEVEIKVFADSFIDGDKKAKPVKLVAGKELGFMMAYCDNDGGPARENFFGSEDISPVNGDRNRGWIDASVFGRLILKK